MGQEINHTEQQINRTEQQIDHTTQQGLNSNNKEELGSLQQDKYNIGYVPGVFDLFHIGHLNLLRKAKERCNYLIAGVLTDELVMHFKGKEPFISFAERSAIVEAIKYVDQVVPISFDNTLKIDAWKLYHYDCHFSGNDHGADWAEDLRQLQEVGSNMEFLQYTLSTSSTQIKKLIEKALV